MKNLFSTFVMLFAFLLISCDGNAQQTKKLPQQNGTQVIQFHSTHRCITCNAIEKLSKETLKEYPKISFKLYNVDEPKNGKLPNNSKQQERRFSFTIQKQERKKTLQNLLFHLPKTNPKNLKKA